MDLEALQRYVRDLTIDLRPPRILPADSSRSRRDAASPGNSAAVAGGSVVSFVAGVSPQHQDDVLNSTLLAQLAADAQFDRTTNTDQWYGVYTTVLGKVGWVIQDFAFQKFSSTGLSVEIDKIVVAILGAIASGDEMAVVTDSLSALRAMSDSDRPLSIFDQQSVSASGGNFQISAASETNNLVAMNLGAFFFTTSQTTTRFLWFTYAAALISIFQSAQAVTLNEDIYAFVRKVVIDKLGANAQNFIADLPI